MKRSKVSNDKLPRGQEAGRKVKSEKLTATKKEITLEE